MQMDGIAGEIEAALRRDFRLLIGGRLTAASDGAEFETYNPATGKRLAAVPNAGAADIEAAVQAARASFPAWRSLPYQERRAYVLKIADVLREHTELLGLLDTLDTGNILLAMRRDAAGAAGLMDYHASVGFELKGESTQLDHNLHYTRREPYGVVLRLLPFNHPIAGAAAALAAPLLAGNCVILKPSPHTPLSALVLGELLAEILPAGVLSVISGDNERVSVPLIRHPGIDRIALTGSVEAGKHVMRLAAERLVPLTLELGGKNPLIIHPDFDIDAAVEIAVEGMSFGWQSHSCASTSRILVHASMEQEFVDRLARRVSAVKVLDPLNPSSEMGAISTREIHERCLHFLERGRAQGARLVVGGDRPPEPSLSKDGMFLTPAVFADVRADMDIARKEIFGPILSVSGWRDYDQMIEVANGLDYGLTAVVLTNDLNTAHRTAEAVEAGYVEINGRVSFALGSPFGGFKQSGLGREGGIEEIMSYTQIKSINVRLGNQNVNVK